MTQPLWYIKQCLLNEFVDWKQNGNGRSYSTSDFIEFLIQRDILGGRRFKDYIDTIPSLSLYDYAAKCPPLREGYIPPNARFGRKDKVDKDG